MEKLIGNFMLVEDVLRYMGNNKLVPLPQYTVKNFPNHFFNTEDVKNKIGAEDFRKMECHVTTHMFVENPELKEALVKYIYGGLGTKDYGKISKKFLVENEQDIQKLLDNKIIGILHLDGIRKLLAKNEIVIVNEKGGYCNAKGTWEIIEKL